LVPVAHLSEQGSNGHEAGRLGHER
jgi:hypothetical protein